MPHEVQRSRIQLAVAAAVSAGTAVNGAAFDTKDYDGVVIFCTIATANAGNFLKAQQGAASDLSDAADLAGSKVITDSDADLAILDLGKPVERYIRGVIIRGGANTATGDMYYVGYNSAQQPVNNDITNTSNVVRLISPAEGTA
jgi:hypothetical protein